MDLEKDGDLIKQVISEFVNQCSLLKGYSCLNDQIKMYIGEFEGTTLTDAAALQGTYTYNVLPIFAEFAAVYTQIDQGIMLKRLQLIEMG